MTPLRTCSESIDLVSGRSTQVDLQQCNHGRFMKISNFAGRFLNENMEKSCDKKRILKRIICAIQWYFYLYCMSSSLAISQSLKTVIFLIFCRSQFFNHWLIGQNVSVQLRYFLIL